MPWKERRVVDYDYEPEFLWPSGNVGLEQEALFTDLHDRFNTVPFFLQDEEAFHCDVSEIANDVENQAEFYARLQKRKDERLEELNRMMRYLSYFMGGGHFDQQMGKPQQYKFIRLQRNGSFDSLITFLSSFLGPNKKGELPDEGLFSRFSLLLFDS